MIAIVKAERRQTPPMGMRKTPPRKSNAAKKNLTTKKVEVS